VINIEIPNFKNTAHSKGTRILIGAKLRKALEMKDLGNNSKSTGPSWIRTSDQWIMSPKLGGTRLK